MFIFIHSFARVDRKNDKICLVHIVFITHVLGPSTKSGMSDGQIDENYLKNNLFFGAESIEK